MQIKYIPIREKLLRKLTIKLVDLIFRYSYLYASYGNLLDFHCCVEEWICEGLSVGIFLILQIRMFFRVTETKKIDFFEVEVIEYTPFKKVIQL